MEPDYFITETGLPNILIKNNKVKKKNQVTHVKKFQYKNKHDLNSNNNSEVLQHPMEICMSKSIKNLHNERLKSIIDNKKIHGNSQIPVLQREKELQQKSVHQ